jgi:hypothetical protein
MIEEHRVPVVQIGPKLPMRPAPVGYILATTSGRFTTPQHSLRLPLHEEGPAT